MKIIRMKVIKRYSRYSKEDKRNSMFFENNLKSYIPKALQMIKET